MRIVFMGTPDFAVPSLKRLISDGYEIVGVFTQPDKPKNRGMKLTPSPVKVVALEHEYPGLSADDLEDGRSSMIVLTALKPGPDRGGGLRQNTAQSGSLMLPKLGCINVHSSLLPRYRGRGSHQLGHPEWRG